MVERDLERYAVNYFRRKEGDTRENDIAAASKYIAFGSHSASQKCIKNNPICESTCMAANINRIIQSALQQKLRRDAKLSPPTRFSFPKEAWLTCLAPPAAQPWHWVGPRR